MRRSLPPPSYITVNVRKSVHDLSIRERTLIAQDKENGTVRDRRHSENTAIVPVRINEHTCTNDLDLAKHTLQEKTTLQKVDFELIKTEQEHGSAIRGFKYSAAGFLTTLGVGMSALIIASPHLNGTTRTTAEWGFAILATCAGVVFYNCTTNAFAASKNLEKAQNAVDPFYTNAIKTIEDYRPHARTLCEIDNDLAAAQARQNLPTRMLEFPQRANALT